MSDHVGLMKVLSSGMVVLRYQGHTRSERDAVWTIGKQRKAARCVVTDAVLVAGDEAFRPVGNQDYRGRRISRDVIWLMIMKASDEGALDLDFEGAPEIEEWFALTGIQW